LRAAGFSPQAFRNLNTPEELAQARNCDLTDSRKAC
jgi:molybdopterin-guanine dinucleotide biosynthesis protein A